MMRRRVGKSAPARSGVSRSTSSSRNRQRRSLPSAVNRRRLQLAQNGSVTLLMKPIWPRSCPAAKRKERAGSWPLCSVIGVNGPNTASMRARVSADGTTCSRWNPAMLPNGINSMKRTSQGFSSVSRARSTTSSSLKPRVTTQLILIGANPAAAAAAIPCCTCVRRVAPGDVFELARIQRVNADVNLIQARLGQRLRQLAQPDPVGGHGNAPDARDGTDFAHQRNNPGAHGWLPAGQTDLIHAQASAHAHQRQDFVVLQQGRRWAEGDIFRHAVDAPQVARICE